MNRIAFLLLFFATGTLCAKPGTKKHSAPSAAQLSQQVASHVSYPSILREGSHEGIVVITFNVTETNKLAKLTVHTTNQELNDDLTRQLTGKKIRLADNNPFETYMVRLHFMK